MAWCFYRCAALGLALLVSYSCGQQSALGDQCEAGQEFPVRHDGALLVGCQTFAGDKWCRRQDSTFVICPEFPVSAAPAAEATEKLSPNRPHVSTPGVNVVISEIMTAHDLFSDDDGETSDWIEIHNAASEAVSFEGWALTDDPESMQKWMMPSIEIESGGYAIVFASGKDRVTPEAAHTNFRLSDEGEYLALVRPDGSVASSVANEYPRQIPNVSYGLAGFEGGDSETELMTFLEEPTPGQPNSGPRSTGPYIASVQHEYEGEMQPPGVDILVSAVIAESAAPIDEVSLTYQVMFGDSATLPMTTSGGADPVYSATIPAAEFGAGEMVRWFVTATDADGNISRDPINATDHPLHYGTVVTSKAQSSLPVLYWFTDSPDASTSVDGHRSAVFFNGRFYDNVFTRRRGVTALTWPKPKIKFDFKGAAFKFQKGESSVEEFNLQSFYDEIGEDSYMREPIAFQVHREAGVPASLSFHVRVQQNGEFFGLFAFVEQIDETFLERNGYKIGGNLFKSVHGQFSNLRWDVKLNDMKFTYSKGNKIGVDNWRQLWEFTQGLAGGMDISRSAFLYDYVNIPEVINYMAVSNLMLNQDRCTKNFYVYQDPSSQRWSIFPWDTEGSMGISSGLRGEPAPDYCILVCEQWNSPFYCDSEHPQDLAAISDLAIETGRRLLQVTQPRTIPRDFRRPSAAVYNADRTTAPSPTGAAGTYNHLDDAILDWEETREMYLRRLRTLMDQFLNGRLETMITELYREIREEAVRDNEKWEVTQRVDSGFEQLISEQLPTRKEQLYDTYGPNGIGIIPDGQPQAATLEVASVELPANLEQQYIEILNPNDYAVDISGWMLTGAVTFRFAPGTVVASKGTVFVTPNINGFRNRDSSPTGGERLFYVGPCTYLPSGTSPAEIQIRNAQAQSI